MNVRTIEASDLHAAGAVLFHAFDTAARSRGFSAPWSDEGESTSLLTEYWQREPEHVLVAEAGGAVLGVGALRLRGEVTSLGPVAVSVQGRGVGGALLDSLLERADAAGAQATRLYVDAWNPAAFALYASRGFAVVDVVTNIEREPGPGPGLGSARGLEVRPFDPNDLEEVTRLDLKLTGNDRGQDLGEMVHLVARRRGAIVGYLGTRAGLRATRLGPAVAVDVSDLFTLLTAALAANGPVTSWVPADRPLQARLSTAAPAASMAALGLGFRVRELGVLMSRGALPPARPPQLYSIEPEVL